MWEVYSGRKITMPKPFLYLLHRHTVRKQKRSATMPQHPEKTLLRNYFAAINSNRKFVMCMRDSFI
ncbi:hypothetical protein Osc2_09640 [Ruminococcus sp. 25CYCFAH16]